MLTPLRALAQNFESGRLMPEIPELADLYKRGLALRHGQVVMVAGRSGTQKSGFALWLVEKWGLPTLYFSADMSAFTASARIASMRAGLTTEEVEQAMAVGGALRRDVEVALADSQVQFSFGSPIRWDQVEEELQAFVEFHDAFPEVIVFDNLMDFEGGESDYAAQMETMSMVTELSRATGSLCLILHHASDKSWEAKSDPWVPPSRDQVKGGLSEKPEVSLSVALDPHSLDYRVAIIKQRMGPCDPTAKSYDFMRAEPQYTRFHPRDTLRMPT